MENVLLCATDAGGARNIAPLIKVIKKHGYKSVLITSKEMKDLFDLENVKLVETTSSNSNFKGYVDKFKPKAIFCGTTRYVSIDRKLIKEGGKQGVKTVVVLDEWFNYRLRFENEKGELEFLPDAIACMDKKAKEGAIEEDISKELCFVTGSPSLSDLTDRVEKFVDNPLPPPDFLKNDQLKPIITFLSQTFAKDYGSKKGDTGPLGPFLGYTEDTVKNDIVSVIKKINKPCVVIEKLHPSSELDDFDKMIDKNIRWIRIKKADLWSLFWYSKGVIGMRSMALLESRIFNRPTISYQPGLLVKDTCTAVVFGLVKRLSTPDELNKWLINQFNKSYEENKRSIKRYPFARKDAAENVVSLGI